MGNDVRLIRKKGGGYRLLVNGHELHYVMRMEPDLTPRAGYQTVTVTLVVSVFHADPETDEVATSDAEPTNEAGEGQGQSLATPPL